MARCIYCGADARPDSVPICLACAEDLEPARKPPAAAVHPGRRDGHSSCERFALDPDDGVACSECGKLEDDRLKAIERYVDISAAHRCIQRECRMVLPALEEALRFAEKDVNDAWRKLTEHKARHGLAASA